MKEKKTTRNIIKSAVSGRFVTKKYATKKGKHTTFSQTVKKGKRK